ncbi:MAG TPA: hypothetical protein VIS51_01295 [Solirubrobacterales bacterium]
MSPADTPPPPEPVKQLTELRVVAQDPSVQAKGEVLTEKIRVPTEHLDPGPRGARFYVLDYDSATGRLQPPATIAPNGKDRFARTPANNLLRSPAFRAQNVYAIAASTLATAEAALGRRLAWGFEGHQLYLVPHAIPEANAFYAPEDGAIYFGYVPDGKKQIQTALSHDVIAHETTHAILDGLRPRFAVPGLPDQPAFHEALADCVALLSVFSLEAVVANLLGEDKDGKLPPAQLTEKALGETALFTLAEQLGVESTRGSGLRRSIELKPSRAWRRMREFEEPHRRGEVFVAAVMQTMLKMWAERLVAITAPSGADRSRVVEEGSTAAAHLLQMLFRGIDYMPPVELEFEDVLDAVLTADEVVAPDDRHGYRTALADRFKAFGITRPEDRIVDITRGPEPDYGRMNFAILRSDRDEVERFLWENAEVLKIDRTWQTRVQFVRPSVRFGPDGLFVSEVVTDYVQRVQLEAREAKKMGVAVPKGVKPTTALELWGGGVVVFDQFGRAKLHQRKPLSDWKRQSRRLAYLARHSLSDTRGRLGFTLSTPRGQRFAALHVDNTRAAEDW